jgi:hypothetical protein
MVHIVEALRTSASTLAPQMTDVPNIKCPDLPPSVRGSWTESRHAM